MAKETMDKILGELDKVKLVLQNVNKTGQFPDIERDIVLSKMRNIYEFLLLIQPDLTTDKELVKKVIPESKQEEEKQPEITLDIQAEIKQETKKEEPAPENKEEIEMSIHEEPEIAPPPPVEKKKKEENEAKGEILAEKLQSTGNFMHDVLTQYVNTFDIAKKHQNQPINDFNSAIGMNDKFLFIKELFNNDTALYKTTIDKLNQADNFNNAIQYIDSNFQWDFENATVHKLLELIRRRFPTSSN